MDEPAVPLAIKDDTQSSTYNVKDDENKDRKEPADTNEDVIRCQDCGLVFTLMDAYETHLHQHALEEEESQLRDKMAQCVAAEENGHKDGSVGAESPGVSGWPSTQIPNSSQIDHYSPVSMNNSRPVYNCGVCGKIYTYLVSFQKHLKIHEEPPEKETPPPQVEHNLRKYECPDCGMSFIRRTRLISHLRVHRSKRLQQLPKCDQCNKVFMSGKSWASHVELHRERRFWCLSCAQGFTTELLLDKHLQNHNADDQGIQNAKPLRSPPKPQPRNMTFHCVHCGKGYWRSKRLFRHKLKHHYRYYDRDANKPPGGAGLSDNIGDEKKELSPANGKEQVEEVQVKEEDIQTEGESIHPEAEDKEDSEDSDCGEPGHGYNFAEHRHSEDQLDQPKLEAVQSPPGRNLESPETKLRREHKYWEWECIECDMGFDEMTKLHSHYVKHATGELPIVKVEIVG
ncbi:PREDICTED: zinc finger protein 184-like isoform X2 [Cyprinodon variegatus]|uniref:zinc finger protein 184-like isoform X2 n=1 Tax=Cyprinodon variegatus TaxID=28743 RepID=UPI00074283D3|nr:PREDICTED: zinc finger protein 184-like isoform X2 [Cyprinodon variegatus]